MFLLWKLTREFEINSYNDAIAEAVAKYTAIYLGGEVVSGDCTLALLVGKAKVGPGMKGKQKPEFVSPPPPANRNRERSGESPSGAS